MSEETSDKLLWLAAGTAVGTCLAILFAPRSGSDTRAVLASRAGDESRELFDRGRDLYEKGRQIAEEAADLFEQGRRIVENPRAQPE